MVLAVGSAHAETAAEMKKVISEQLVYPREARLVLPAALPSSSADAARNAEWLAVARALAQAGLIELRQAGGNVTLAATERALDVVQPRMNMKYETTAVSVTLGRWDIGVSRVERSDGRVVAHGRRTLKPTRALEPALAALAPASAAPFKDQDMRWVVSRTDGNVQVQELSE